MRSKVMAATLIATAVGLGAVGALAVAAAPALAAGRGFTARVTNPYYPLLPGMRWEYRGVKDGRPLRDVVVVTKRIERIGGVPCAVVIDRGYVDGRLAESTIDWFAQDGNGTVWYFGEATQEVDRQGRVTSTEGSWRAGTDGARQGVFMPAHPHVGQSFAQEHYPGHAEDHFKIVSAHGDDPRPLRDLRAPRPDDRGMDAAGARRARREVVREGDRRGEGSDVEGR